MLNRRHHCRLVSFSLRFKRHFFGEIQSKVSACTDFDDLSPTTRACGDVFCATHSSRATFLWPSTEEEQMPQGFTPRGTPRGTPRSSALDLPSLAYSVSPSSSSISTSSSSTATSSSAPTCSPTPPRQPSLPAPVSARVCDRCYFSAPTPLLTPPASNHSGSFSFHNAFSSANPLTLRQPRSRQHSASRNSSPAHSPPGHHSLGRSSSARVRSRTGSAASLSTASDGAASYSSPATSVEVLPTIHSNKVPPPPHRRELSPATSIRGMKPVIAFHPSLDKFSNSPDHSSDEDQSSRRHGDDSDSDEDEAKHEQVMRDRRRYNQEFGSVQGGPWQSWATF